MHPLLGDLRTPWGETPIYTYGILVAAGVLIGLIYARQTASRQSSPNIDPERVWNLGIYMVLAALVASKAWLVVATAGYYRRHPHEIFTFSTLQSGGTFYGGLLGAVIAAIVYTHFQRMPLLPLADLYAPGLALGHAIGRIGCFAAGCCYGKPTWLPWGVTFTNPIASSLVGTPLNVPLHPTQLYEAAAEFLNFLILLALARQKRFAGQIFGAYLLLYGFERGLIEFLRADPDRTLFANGRFSLMQVVSVLLIFIGIWLWRRGSKASVTIRPAAATLPR